MPPVRGWAPPDQHADAPRRSERLHADADTWAAFASGRPHVARSARAEAAAHIVRHRDAIARDASDARDFDANESMRPNERWGRSIESSRRLANASRSNDARDGMHA